MSSKSAVGMIMLAGMLFSVLPTQAQTTWYVDDDASLGGDGASWNTAFRYLQDALATATAGDEIRVAGGTYQPDRDELGNVLPGDREATFHLISGVGIYGGYAGLAGGGPPDTRDLELHVSVLSGDLDGDDAPDFENNEENSYHVVTGSDTQTTAILDGFVITGGNANQESRPHGLGAGMLNDYGDPTLRNCIFLGNSAYDRGGGLNNNHGSPTLTDCVFEANRAHFGGGLAGYFGRPELIQCAFLNNSADWYAAGMSISRSDATLIDTIFVGNTAVTGGGALTSNIGSPTLLNCTFLENSTTMYGSGAISFSGGGPTVINSTFVANTTAESGGAIASRNDSELTLRNCKFIGNTAELRGGAMHNDASSPDVVNCLFSGNSARSGGGMYNDFESNPTLTNCTLSGNSATDLGGGILTHGRSPTISHSILWNNSDSRGVDALAQVFVVVGSPCIDYSCVQGCWTGCGSGNICDDPLFIDNDGEDQIAGTEDDNLRLLWNSPCINRGDYNFEPAPGQTDLDGQARKLCWRVDLGAYEFGAGDFDCNRTVGLLDFSRWPGWLTGPGLDLDPYDPRCAAFDIQFDGDVDLADFARLRFLHRGHMVSVECCLPDAGLRGVGPCLSGPGAAEPPSACESGAVCTLGFSETKPNWLMDRLCRPESTLVHGEAGTFCWSWHSPHASTVALCQAVPAAGVDPFSLLDEDGDGDLDLVDFAVFQRTFELALTE